MDLERLTKRELQTEFLTVNSEYLRLSSGNASSYFKNKKLRTIRKKLRALMDELRNRREGQAADISE